MAFSELEIHRIKRIMDAYLEQRRPPPHIRSQLDIAYRVQGQSVEIFEVRPAWNAPQEKMENSVAKAAYVKTQRIWKIYWQRADLKWHGYEPVRTVENLEAFLAVVEKDENCCFWG